MTAMPTVARGTMLVLRSDGTEQVFHNTSLADIKTAIGATRLDFVSLTWIERDVPGGRTRRVDLVMAVDDEGYEYRTVQVSPILVRNEPIRPLKPYNERATALFRAVCDPKYRDHRIVGDVAILHDRD